MSSNDARRSHYYISFDKDVDYSSLTTKYKKNKFLKPIVIFDIIQCNLIEYEIYENDEIQIQKFCDSQKNLFEAFEYASTKNAHTQILTQIIPVEFSSKTIASVMPEVSEYQIKKDRKHVILKGKGFVFTKNEIFRENIKPQVLDFFFNNLLSAKILFRTLHTVLLH